MEQIAIWVGILITPVLAFIGWIFRNLIARDIDILKADHGDTKKQLDELSKGMSDKAKEGFETVFKRLDANKEYVEKTFLREKEYKIALEYQEKQTDQKIVSSFTTLNTLIQGLEDKIEIGTKNTSEKFDDIKNMIKDLKANK